MNPEIQNYIDQQIQQMRNDAFNVPNHIHNGLDAPNIPMRSVYGVFKGEATYNPSSLSDGTGETTTVAVAESVLGDFAVASFSLDLQGITMTAYVSAKSVVSVRFQNESGGTINLASGTLSVFIIKKF